MKYYYLIDITCSNAMCFNSKKDMVEYAKNHCVEWYFVNNKKDLPRNIKYVIGNAVCKDYKIKNESFVMKDSLKDRRK